jgi:hypothetical protein
MSRRSQADRRAPPLALNLLDGPDRRLARRETGERCTAWSVYRQAMESGWGATCRLCLILAMRWGVPLTAGVKVVSLLLGHFH